MQKLRREFSRHLAPRAEGGAQLRLEEADIPKELSRYIAERISTHETALYKNMGYFVTITTALMGAVGYLALQRLGPWWKVQRIAWALWWLEGFVALVFTISIVLHYSALRRHWNDQCELGLKRSVVPRHHVFRHVEFWFVLSMWAVFVTSYIWIFKPLFG
jgi:hypothetical protein